MYLTYTGRACRLKATTTLARKFPSPTAAQEYYATQHKDDVQVTQSEISPAQPQRSTAVSETTASQQGFASMDPVEQLNLLSDMFTLYLQQHTHIQIPPSDFICLAIQGMERLRKAGRKNVIYLMAKALGTARPDGSDSLLPTSRMPMGLVEHIVNFFTATSLQQVGQHHCYTSCIIILYVVDILYMAIKVSCPPDYRCWLQTMYALFGTKWAKVFCGPMWSYVPIMQTENVVHPTSTSNAMAPVNVGINSRLLNHITLLHIYW